MGPEALISHNKCDSTTDRQHNFFSTARSLRESGIGGDSERSAILPPPHCTFLTVVFTKPACHFLHNELESADMLCRNSNEAAIAYVINNELESADMRCRNSNEAAIAYVINLTKYWTRLPELYGVAAMDKAGVNFSYTLI